MLCLCIILPETIEAQEGNTNFLSLSFGASDFHIRDDHASPLFFRSIGIAPSIQYLHKTENEVHALECSYYYDYLSSDQPNFNTDNWRGSAKYTYARSVSEFSALGNSVNVYVGASVSSFLSLSQYRHNGDNLAITSWYWHHSLNAELCITYTMQNNDFAALQVSIPVVGNIARPEYSPSKNYSYKENEYEIQGFGETVLFPVNMSVNVSLSYRVSLSETFSLLGSYEFFYAGYAKPKEVDMYMNNFRAGLCICF